MIRSDGVYRTYGSSDPSKNTTTLFGAPFPPDDVKAYWSLVPVDIYVQWYPGIGLFCVTKYPLYDHEQNHAVAGRIHARDAHKLSVWMTVISELVNGKP